MGEVFTFDVGHDDVKSFKLHSRLVSMCSPVFDAMMNGKMKEANEGRVQLKNVDHETFTRFAEHLYGQDYNPAEALVMVHQPKDSETLCSKLQYYTVPTKHAAEPVSGSVFGHDAFSWTEPLAATDNEWSSFTSSKKHRTPQAKVGPKRSPQLETLQEFALPSSQIELFPSFHNKEARNDVGLMYDYSEVLSHVKLYVFAEQYQIDKLKQLVLDKLRKALDQTKFHPRKMDDFLDILVIAYEGTCDSDDKEPMRNLLTLFGAWHFRDLVASENYPQLIEDHKDCVAHLCQKVARRL